MRRPPCRRPAARRSAHPPRRPSSITIPPRSPTTGPPAFRRASCAPRCGRNCRRRPWGRLEARYPEGLSSTPGGASAHPRNRHNPPLAIGIGPPTRATPPPAPWPLPVLRQQPDWPTPPPSSHPQRLPGPALWNFAGPFLYAAPDRPPTPSRRGPSPTDRPRLGPAGGPAALVIAPSFAPHRPPNSPLLGFSA